MARLHVIFTGKVQGVFFRANSLRKARELGLVGSIRNQADGTVEAIIEGDKETIMDLIDWCENKQPLARVENINKRWEEPTGEFSDFRIVR